MVSGERVKQAREFRGWTQAELAKRVGVTQSAIAQIEAELVQPSEKTFADIVAVTCFLPAFFHQGPPPDVPLGTLLFRARSATTAMERMQVHRYAQALVEITREMFAKVKPLPVNIPRLIGTLEEPINPVHAARITRTTLGLSPDVPITELIRALERHGALVFALPSELQLRGVDAFSFWTDVDTWRPVVVVASDVPGDRLRWSVAHELGHLVVHQSPEGTLTQFEQQANQFAAEFLLPAVAMRQELVSPITLNLIVSLKPRWQVSMQALIRRAYDLRIVSDRQYRYLFEQLGARGWRMQEPPSLDIPIEKPRAVRQLAEMLYKYPQHQERLVADTRFTETDLADLLEGFAEGQKTGTDGSTRRRSESTTRNSDINSVVPFIRRR